MIKRTVTGLLIFSMSNDAFRRKRADIRKEYLKN